MEAELQTTDDATTEAELAAAEEEKHEGFVKADDSQKDINKQHKKFRDEERGHVKTQAELDSVNKELADLKAQSVDTTIPPLPDKYAEDFDQQMQVRDDAIKRSTAHDAEQTRLEDASKEKEKEQTDQQESVLREQISTFDANMVQIGLNPAETKAAATTIADYGVTDVLQEILLTDEEGPLMVHYLASNPVQLEELNGMSALQLVNYLTTEVKPKASLLRPKTSEAPDPPITLSGGGVKETQNQLPNDNTYTLE